jgi:hypothetical protein
MQPRRLVLTALVAALCVVAVPSVASAAPCWHRVIADWTKDGVINGHYSPKCLRKAYRNTPEDLRDYSGILDDINAALIATGSKRSPGSGPGTGGSSGTANGTNSTPAAAKKKEAARRAKAAKIAVPGAGTSASTPGHDRSIPLPLIILGAVVLAGALAGAAPSLITRSRGRFPRLRPNPDSVRPPA